MKKKTRLLALLTALVLLLGLTACGASAGGMAPQGSPSEGWSDNAAMDTESGGPADVTAVSGRKIIYTAYMELESLDYTDTVTRLMQAMNRAGGYIQNSSQRGSEEEGNRSAEYTFRIPADKYDSFLNDAENTGNALYRNEETSDVTAEYVDVEARVKSLEGQRDRLLELQQKAESLEDLLAIENQLTQVQYELESYTGQKRVLDDQIDLSTVTVSVYEVKVMTPASNNFGTRITTAFTRGWTDFGVWLQDVAVDLTGNLPWLLLAAVLLAVLVPAVRRASARKAGEDLPKKKRRWGRKKAEKKTAGQEKTLETGTKRDAGEGR